MRFRIQSICLEAVLIRVNPRSSAARLNYPTVKCLLCELDSLLIPILNHGQDVARRVFEPGDHWASIPMNTLFIRLDFTFVFLEADAQIREFINGCFNIFHDKVQNRETCGSVTGFGIDKYTLATQVHI